MSDVTDTQAPAPSTERTAGGGGKRRTGLLVGGLVALVAIGVAVALLLSAGGSEKSTGPARYDIVINNGWPQTEDEKRIGSYLESAWRDPVGPTITIDSRVSDETGSPMANAEQAQILITKLPGFRERGLKRIRLGGRPAVRWAFDIADESRIYYFFEECGTSFIVRGAVIPVGFTALSETFRRNAASIKVACDE